MDTGTFDRILPGSVDVEKPYLQVVCAWPWLCHAVAHANRCWHATTKTWKNLGHQVETSMGWHWDWEMGDVGNYIGRLPQLPLEKKTYDLIAICFYYMMCCKNLLIHEISSFFAREKFRHWVFSKTWHMNIFDPPPNHTFWPFSDGPSLRLMSLLIWCLMSRSVWTYLYVLPGHGKIGCRMIPWYHNHGCFFFSVTNDGYQYLSKNVPFKCSDGSAEPGLFWRKSWNQPKTWINLARYLRREEKSHLGNLWFWMVE